MGLGVRFGLGLGQRDQCAGEATQVRGILSDAAGADVALAAAE